MRVKSLDFRNLYEFESNNSFLKFWKASDKDG